MVLYFVVKQINCPVLLLGRAMLMSRKCPVMYARSSVHDPSKVLGKCILEGAFLCVYRVKHLLALVQTSRRSSAVHDVKVSVCPQAHRCHDMAWHREPLGACFGPGMGFP